MLTPIEQWDLLILDGAAPAKDLGSLAIGDIDGDGNVEIVTAGSEALLWYRPATYERGVITDDLVYQVGLVLEDVDGDGILEVIIGDCDPPTSIFCFKPSDAKDLHQPWQRYLIDGSTTGSPHDLVVVDIDGDGKTELLASAIDDGPGLYLYKQPEDPRSPWEKHAVQVGIFGEGTAAADLTGDGRIEIVFGPYLYTCPPEGPYAGAWERSELAPAFREMCKAAVVDVTGNGRPDVILVESEYPDGRLSWFENRVLEDPENPWREHPLDRPLNFAHSLAVWSDVNRGASCIFVAEMAQGGWNPPYNWDARLLQYTTADEGQTWSRDVVHQGAGTHEAVPYDVDGDGVLEFIGKECWRPKIQIWRRPEKPPRFPGFRHRFLDREKPYTGTDIQATDVDGDGLQDIVCAAWWYKNPTWERYQIPGVYQVHTAYDIDSDGRGELIATKKTAATSNWYEGLSSELCWLKPIDPVNGRWEEHPIGSGRGDWPHATLVGPVLPGGRLALVVGYHSADEGHFPEIFELPDDPTQHPWPKRTLAEINYGEEMVAYDMTGDGNLDIAGGWFWLENKGDGSFHMHQVAKGLEKAARVRVADMNDNGRPDIVVVEESLDYEVAREAHFVRIAWLENPGDPRSDAWNMHIVDTVRSPHSLDVADLDGDGQLEIVVGEHDPFKPYRSRSRLFVYKKAEPGGRAWYRYVLDDRFEHHDGTKVVQLTPGRFGIVSHGWADSRYVHLWEPC